MGTKYNHILFYGDSLTSGENNQFNSFVDKLDIKSIKLGISGTTFGNYSIYPVGHESCIEKLYRTEFEDFESYRIFLEYGINDATSVCLDYCTVDKVLIDFRKCIDYIKQVCDAQITFLGVNDIDILNKIGNMQKDYIMDQYLPSFFSVDVSKWVRTYQKIYNFGYQYCDSVIDMFRSYEEFADNIDTDDLHPNDAGYEIIAKNIMYQIENNLT